MRNLLVILLLCTGLIQAQKAVLFVGQPGAIPVEINTITGMGCIPGGSAGQVLVTDGAGECTPTAVTISGSAVTGSLVGNASTATALAANPTDCAANQFANAIAASGNLTCAAPFTLTTTGSSGAATFSSGTLNIPQYSGGGSSDLPTVSVTASTYTMLSANVGAWHNVHGMDPTTITLPAATGDFETYNAVIINATNGDDATIEVGSGNSICIADATPATCYMSFVLHATFSLQLTADLGSPGDYIGILTPMVPGGGSSAFSAITSGTNTGAAMVVGSGASLGVSGSGTIAATTSVALATARAINGVNFDGTAAITVTAAAGTLSGATLNSGVTASSLTSVGTLTGGSTGSGFTIALSTSTVTGTLVSARGGTGVSNTATLTLGSSNQNWATLATGIVKNTTTTGALSAAVAADVYGLWSGSCSSSTFLRGDGSCQTPAGSGDVVGPGSATDNAIVRFDSTTGKLIQNSVVTIADTSGNISSPGTLAVGVGGSDAGGFLCGAGSATAPSTSQWLLQCPAAVTAYTTVVPGATGSGFWFGTDSSGTETITRVSSATVTRNIASGAKALATGAIASEACTSAQTDTATGTATTDAIIATFNGDPTAVTGYIPLVAGMLTIITYPTTNTVNFKVCNNTTSSITPGAVTINWKVVR